MLSRAESLAPRLPLVANPMDWRAEHNRAVIRAHGRAKVGKRSVKILRGHA